MAVPAPLAAGLVSRLPADTADALGRIAYGAYVVGAFLTAEPGPMPYDHVYAMATPKLSFNMLFNMASVVRGDRRRPGGSLMVYSGASLATRLDRLDDRQVLDVYQRELTELFPALKRRFDEAQLVRWRRGLPHPRPGRGDLQPALTRPLQRVFLAGDYLGTSYVETAVRTGREAAEGARAWL